MVPVLNFLKKHWMVIAAALVIIAIVMIFMSMRKEKYYDYEMTGCSTCSAGDAGVFDHEEMYYMPDDYYSDAETDEIYEDDTFAGDEDEIYEDDTFADDEDEIYEDDTFAGDEDVYGDGYVVNDDDEAMATAEEESMDDDVVFADEVMDGMDGEEDVDMLEIDELDAEEENYAELM